jgi:UDP-N-acetylmuramate: L-alanyl-gamma-D-glutamyl-meso-diaminopimelate ligase
VSRPDQHGGFAVMSAGAELGRVSEFSLPGEHNQLNALSALLAARHAGVALDVGLAALATFPGVKRRLETRGIAAGVTVIDDFAHHPTAFAATIAGLRQRVGPARIFAILEPRSNTMKRGAMKDLLAGSLAGADRVVCYANKLGWEPAEVLAPLGAKASCFDDLEALINAVASEVRTGDQVLVMSNGGFGGIHDKLLAVLAT